MRTSRLVVASALAVALTSLVGAQKPGPFTADDMLKVATASVLDLTENGDRVALAIRTLEHNATTDHRRFGDPTYLAPSMVNVVVYDTRTGRADQVFPALMNVRQAAWSRDGASLALFTASEDADRLPVITAWVWDAARRVRLEVPMKAGALIAATSELNWLPDGTRLLVALRDGAEDRAAQAAFKRLIEGPTIVHTSKDPGDQDPNVPASQSREIYYALRRLGREVEWVRYVNGGHRPPNSVSESIDFEKRILAWYDKYLKPSPANPTAQP
jgi:dipeptidyl aminopeptidase/acylaminoacyl peptidase